MSKTTDTGAPLDLDSLRQSAEYARVRDEFAIAARAIPMFDVDSAMLNVDSLLSAVLAAAPSPQSASVDAIGQDIIGGQRWSKEAEMMESWLRIGQPEQSTPLGAIGQDERALFEAWALRSGWSAKTIAARKGDGYDEPHLTDYWGCWRDACAALTHPSVSPAPAEQKFCSHVWNDFGQLGGRNVSWCPRCDTLAWTGKEPEPVSPAPVVAASDEMLSSLDAVIGAVENNDIINARGIRELYPVEEARKAIDALRAAASQAAPASLLEALRKNNPAFVEHLERNAAEVATWPAWKTGMWPDAAAPATCQPSGAIGQGTAADPDECKDGGKCGVGGYCKECPHATPAEPSRAAIDPEARDA